MWKFAYRFGDLAAFMCRTQGTQDCGQEHHDAQAEYYEGCGIEIFKFDDHICPNANDNQAK